MKNKIKLIFTGTAEISTPLLRSLAKDDRFDVLLVITQMDKPAGRKMELTKSPIKKNSEELNLEIFQPENINDPTSIETIKEKNPNVMIVMAYGQIFGKKILNAPQKG